eukprot:489914-Prymnesium_polylepis.2
MAALRCTARLPGGAQPLEGCAERECLVMQLRSRSAKRGMNAIGQVVCQRCKRLGSCGTAQ